MNTVTFSNCDIDKAYIAGLLDADGSISIVRVTSKKTLEKLQSKSPLLWVQVTITNSYEPVINSLVSLYKGTKRTRKINGRVYYYWNIASKAATNLLKDILPYLRIKRKQAIIAIDFQGKKRNPERQTAIQRNEHGRILVGSRLQDWAIKDEEKARMEIRELNSLKGKFDKKS